MNNSPIEWGIILLQSQPETCIITITIESLEILFEQESFVKTLYSNFNFNFNFNFNKKITRQGIFQESINNLHQIHGAGTQSCYTENSIDRGSYNRFITQHAEIGSSTVHNSSFGFLLMSDLFQLINQLEPQNSTQKIFRTPQKIRLRKYTHRCPFSPAKLHQQSLGKDTAILGDPRRPSFSLVNMEFIPLTLYQDQGLTPDIPC